MKKLLLFILLLVSIKINAQNYQCLQAGVKHYFTNNNHYLRGIRIDSTSIQGSNIIYYPFHTLRYPYAYWTTSNNGSWLGGHVIQQPDGTFLFDNMWGDTVIIKTQAGVGSSWTFYNDTTALNYKATVTAIDTMTVLGVLDSVKKITINAYAGSVAAPNDVVNNFQLTLSKNNGFVQIFDLFTFPYHKPDTNLYALGFDYHLDTVCNDAYPLIPNYNNSIFRISDFHFPTKLEVYDFSIGDVFEIHIYDEFNFGNTTTSEIYTCDTIISKTIINPYHTQYATKHGYNRTSVYSPIGGPSTTSYQAFFGTGAIDADTTTFANVNVMPEEFGYNSNVGYLRWDTIFYYNPADTSWGFTSPSCNTHLCPNSAYVEWCPSLCIYKNGLLPLEEDYCSSDGYFPDDLHSNRTLIFCIKNGIPHGNYHPLFTNLNVKIIAPSEANIFPNPATDIVHMQFNTQENRYISITNLLGQTMATIHCNNTSTDLSISNFQDGIYDINIQTETNTTHKKIVVKH